MAGRTVKCRYCGKQIPQPTAYKVVNGKVNVYYCNEEEYRLDEAQKQKKKDAALAKAKERDEKNKLYNELVPLFDQNLTIINGYTYKILRTLLEELQTKHSDEEIKWYLTNEISNAAEIIDRKTFDSEFLKYRYFCAIIRNNISEYIMRHPLPSPHQEDPKLVEIDFYMAPPNYKPQKIRKAMSEVELFGDE